ncbi:MAG: hypothetical protein AAF982_00015 [Pseudomonadota bacterium]
MTLRSAYLLLTLALSACAAPSAEKATRAAADRAHLGIDTRLLDDDLVSFQVRMRGTARVDDLDVYARCAAAQYALIRGYDFTRHIRTNTRKEGGVWQADAVYTISQEFPPGLRSINAEDMVDACKANGVPTV